MKNKYKLGEILRCEISNEIGIVENILISRDEPSIYRLFVLNKTFSSYEWFEEKGLVRLKEEDKK